MNIFQSISKYFSDRKTKKLLAKIEKENLAVEQEKRDAELKKQQDDARTAELIADYKYKEKHGLLYSQRHSSPSSSYRSSSYSTDYDSDYENRNKTNDSGDFLISAGIAAVTDSALLGGIIGGDMTGGIVGDLLDGDLFD